MYFKVLVTKYTVYIRNGLQCLWPVYLDKLRRHPN